MSCVYYNNSILHIEKVNLNKIAEKYGTPIYIYSRQTLEQRWHLFNKAFASIPHLICYAVKANSNIAILNLMAKLTSGFDIVSSGELKRVITAKGDKNKIIFSGVGKKLYELEEALDTGIFCFNIESEAELERLSALLHSKQSSANIALRINPNINPYTHDYIATGLNENKFGIDLEQVISIATKIKKNPQLNLICLACHIGSQLTQLPPFLLALDRLLDIYKQLSALNFNIQFINLGGGLGIAYTDEQPPSIEEYAEAIIKKIKPYPLTLILEPGRAIIGPAGILLTRIEYMKNTSHKNFAIVDAGMNDFIRPALYEAQQTILSVNLNQIPQKIYDIAGPICESADFMGKNRSLAILPGDLLAIDAVGAYGFSMTSNYNSRCRPAELLIDGENMHLIRRRETIDDQLTLEKMI